MLFCVFPGFLLLSYLDRLTNHRQRSLANFFAGHQNFGPPCKHTDLEARIACLCCTLLDATPSIT